MATPPPAAMGPLPPNENRGPDLIGVAWTWVTLATVIVALRFAERIRRRALGIDDWLMLLALSTFIVMESFLTKLALVGGFRHIAWLTPEQATQVVWWALPLETVGILTLIPSKCSVGFLILRILGPTCTTQRWIAIVTMVTLVIFNVVNVIIVWEAPAETVSYSDFAGAWNAIGDAVLALLPVSFLWQLNMSLGQRIKLILLMSLGLIAAVCAAVKTSKLSELTSAVDVTWNTFPVHLLASTENFLVIFCGSIPPLHRPAIEVITTARNSRLARVLSNTSLWSTTRGGSVEKTTENVSEASATPNLGSSSSEKQAYNITQSSTQEQV